MNSSSSLRERRIVAGFFAIWALVSIGVATAIFLAPTAEHLHHPFVDTRLGSAPLISALAPGAREGPASVGDVVLEMNGRPFGELLRASPVGLRADVPNSYLLEKEDGERVLVSLLPEPLAWAITPALRVQHALLILVGIVYLVAGAVAFRQKPERRESFALFLFCCAMASQITSAVSTDLLPWGWIRVAVDTPLVAATALHLFAVYPVEARWLAGNSRRLWIPYGVAALLALLSLAGPSLALPSGAGPKLSLYSLWLAFVLSLGGLALARRRQSRGEVRDRLDLIFLSALVAFLPVMLIFGLEWFFETPLPHWPALCWTFSFPVAAAYGILRRKPFEFRMVAKSSAIYGAATLAITGIFAFLITFANAVAGRLDVGFRWFDITFLFLAILAFNPLRERLQALVDRIFDRDRQGYRVAVREISDAMVSMLSLPEIADRILLALTDTMGVERAMVLLLEDDARSLRANASRGEWEESARNFEILPDHPIWRHLWTRRENLSRSDFGDEADQERSEACREVFDNLGIEILVPILYGVDLLGVIAVGRKLSGDPLVADDRTLLRTLANQSSIAIENAKAFDEIAKLNATLEARVEARTLELRETQAQLSQAEKMKSLGQLVSGVAHELNNPIGFVHANLQLLEEYVQKLLDAQERGADTSEFREAIDKLLTRSREGTQRVTKIVQDLRTFSRMDQAELQDADLNEEIERTIALMEPRCRNCIEIERDFSELPPVRCYPGQLNQVFLNLMMNACDAIEDEGRIVVKTRAVDSGVRLEFSDDGPGIPEEVQSRIFDPFFTTKPVGAGTGLGLSLSHGILERHGGRILVDSEVGVGTTFALELPLVAEGAS